MSENTHSYLSQSISRFDIVLSNSLFDCRIFWARIVSGESESLFTQYLKHSFYELQYSLKGSIPMLLENNTELSVCEKDFVIIPPETYHQITDTTNTAARFILAFSFETKSQKLSDSLKKALKTVSAFHNTKAMDSLLKMIIEKTFFDSQLRKEAIRSLMESFFIEMLETVCGYPASLPIKENSDRAICAVEAMEEYIKNSYGVGITVLELSKRFSFSRRHLQRLFLLVRGYTPKDAINKERLKRIEELTVSTALSFNEISRLCGFCDEYAMNKFFRRHNKTNLSRLRQLKESSNIR